MIILHTDWNSERMGMYTFKTLGHKNIVHLMVLRLYIN